jgi:hypothetical protein
MGGTLKGLGCLPIEINTEPDPLHGLFLLARTEALSAPSILQPAAVGLDASATIDLTTSEICPGTSCPPVIGNVLVYRDNHHLTAEYSSSLAPFLTKALTGLRAEGFAAGRLDAVLPP